MILFFVEYYAAALLHELAHALMAEWCGVRVKGFRFRWGSLAIVRETGSTLSNLVVSLAGPAMSLFVAWLAWPYLAAFAWANLCIGDRALSCLEKLGWIRRTPAINPRLRWLLDRGYSRMDVALLEVAQDGPGGVAP